jgi:hypothetical protein
MTTMRMTTMMMMATMRMLWPWLEIPWRSLWRRAVPGASVGVLAPSLSAAACPCQPASSFLPLSWYQPLPPPPPPPPHAAVAPARPFPSSICFDKSRRDIGKSQSVWTDSKMETAGSLSSAQQLALWAAPAPTVAWRASWAAAEASQRARRPTPSCWLTPSSYPSPPQRSRPPRDRSCGSGAPCSPAAYIL